MKKRALSILLACVFLLSVFMFCTTAFAAENTSADGVTAVLDTDKDAYVAGDTINVTLDVENTSIYVDNIRTELIIPAGVTLIEGELKNTAALAAGESVTFNYGLAVSAVEIPTTQAPTTQAPTTQAPTTQAPTTQAPTTVAPTTQPGTDDDTSPETRGFAAVIYGTLAIASLAGLAALTFGAKLMKQRWFVLVLCGALLMGVLAPMSTNAAVTERSFEVVKAITIGGADAEVKAIVSYDLDGNELMDPTTIPYKAEGQFLWNLGDVEYGYYLPSDVTYEGQKTSKDDTYRPEVTAPYIDMLFGTEKLGGRYKVENMFNVDAEQSVLIGRTDDVASLKALDHIKKDEWIVTVIDGKIVVTGWYDDATVAAVAWLNEQVTADAADIALKLPHKGKMDYAHGNAPDLAAGTFMNGMNSDQGAVMLRYADVTAEDFAAYTDALVAAGYKLYSENTLEGYGDAQCLFATYVNGDDVVHVQYLPSSLANATDEEIAGFNSAMKKAYEASYRAADTEIRIVLETTDNLFPVDDPDDLDLSHVGGVAQPEQMHVVNLYNSYGDGNDVGACHVFTLADGSFFVWDGGLDADAEQLYRTLKYLNKRDDGIVIAGWVLTHAHNDHIACYQALADSEWAKEITVEKVIVNRLADSYSWRGFNDPYGYAYGSHAAMAIVESLATKFAGGEEVQIVVPHMGQVMELRNLNIETLTVGDEDIFPVILNNDNAGSHVAKISFDGIDQTIMMLADSCLDQTYNVFFPLMLDELDADILQAAHHGLGGNTSRLYPIFNLNPRAEKVAIWNTSYRSLKDNNYTYDVKNGKSPEEAAKGAYLAPGQSPDNLNRLWTDMNKALRPENGGAVEEDIVADEYVTTMNFPYAPGEAVKIYIGNNKSDFFDFENVKLAVLPTFRFKNSIETYLEAFKKYVHADDPDILALTVFDWMADEYNGKDVDTIKLLAEELGYPFTHYSPAWACDNDGSLTTGEGTIGQLVLSRYPIASAETIVLNEGTTGDSNNEGRSAGHVVVDMDGMLVDIYATHFGTSDNWNAFAENFAPKGDYWFILGNTKVSNVTTISNNLGGIDVQQAVSGQSLNILASGNALLSEEKFDSTIASVVGCDRFDQYVRVTAELGRKVLCSDMVIGEFDETPTVGQWWCNWLNDKAQKEQVLRWLIQEKPELVGLVHVPTEVLDDEAAAEFAKLAGYEYCAYVVAEEGRCGHMLLSHYPIESTDRIALRAEPAEIDGKKYEGRHYGHSVVDMTAAGLGKVDVYYGENDSGGAYLTEHRNILEAAIKANADASGREFILCAGYNESHIKSRDTYAGRAFKGYFQNIDANCIVVSDGLPMSGRAAYGTKKYPVNGESPVGVTIANIDPYYKVELVKAAEYQVTVESGTGSGLHEAEKTVKVSANAPAKGKAFDRWVLPEGVVLVEGYAVTDATIEFIMPNNPVTVTATYKDVPVTEKDPTGEETTLKVVMQPVFRFSGKWVGNEQTIIDYYKSFDADVLALTVVDYNAERYNKTDVVNQLIEALDYPYYYYGPSWMCDADGNLENYDGTIGHLVLSKYEITYSENIVTVDGSNPSVEGRSVAHVVVKLDDNTAVDVYATHVGTAAVEWPVLAANFNQKGDYFLILGNTKIGGNGAKADGYLGVSGTTSSCNADITMLGSNGLTFSGECKPDGTISSVLKPNMDPLHAVDVVVPLLGEAVTKYGINVDGKNVGFYAAGDTVTLTAPTPAAGYVFSSWTIPNGVTLTEGDVSSATIQFTMPAQILDFSVNLDEVTTATVTFNANGGTGTMKSVTQNVGSYTLPANGFMPPKNHQFKGWATSANGEVIAEATIDLVDSITLYAIWDEYDYPTYSTVPEDSSLTQTISFLEWWGVGASKNLSATAEWLAKAENHVAVAALVHSKIASEADAAQFAANAGYAHYWWISSDAGRQLGHLLLSDYPFEKADVLTLVEDNPADSTEGRTFGYAIVNVNGTKLDVFFGENNSGASGSNQNILTVEPWVAGHVAESCNVFVVTGYNFSRGEDTSFSVMDKSVNNSSGTILYCAGIKATNGAPKVAGLGGDEPICVDLTFVSAAAMPGTYSVMQWDVSNFGRSESIKNDTIAKIKEQNKDIVVLNGVSTQYLYTDTIATLAEKMGYAYYDYAAANTYDVANGYQRGTLLLSKYPITILQPVILRADANGGSPEGRCYGHAQIFMAGKTVDVYYGETDGGNDYVGSMTAILAKVNEIYLKTGNEFMIMCYKFRDADVNTYHNFVDVDGNAVSLYGYSAGNPGGGIILSPKFTKTMGWFNKTTMLGYDCAYYSHGVSGTITIAA